MRIFVTGGAGYIGSHTVIELIRTGHDVVVADNLHNSSPVAMQRVAQIVGREVPFYQADIRDRAALERIFEDHSFDCCIHFAGLKAMGESVVKPWDYYDNNIGGTLVLVDVMRRHGCKSIIFSSSATVYGDPAVIPIPRRAPRGAAPIPTGRRNPCWRTSSQTYIQRT